MEMYKNINLVKILNIVILVVLCGALAYLYLVYDNWCTGKDIYCNYQFNGGIYAPLLFGGRILAVILAILLIVPSRLFVKWLVFLAMPMIAITYLLVINISVYSSGILSMSRAQVAQLGMVALGILTLLFVGGHLLYDRRKKKVSVLK